MTPMTKSQIAIATVLLAAAAGTASAQAPAAKPAAGTRRCRTRRCPGSRRQTGRPGRRGPRCCARRQAGCGCTRRGARRQAGRGCTRRRGPGRPAARHAEAVGGARGVHEADGGQLEV